MECKECHCPIEASIEGEPVCKDCWTRGQQSSESLALDAQIAWFETHCASCEQETHPSIIQQTHGYCLTCDKDNKQMLQELHEGGV